MKDEYFAVAVCNNECGICERKGRPTVALMCVDREKLLPCCSECLPRIVTLLTNWIPNVA